MCCLLSFVEWRLLFVGYCPLFAVNCCLLGVLWLLSFGCLLVVFVICFVSDGCLVFDVNHCLLCVVFCSAVAVRCLVSVAAPVEFVVYSCLLFVVVGVWLVCVD